MLEPYRKTMNIDVLHSWAEDAQRKIEEQSHVLAQLRNALTDTYSLAPEGREWLDKIDAAMYR